MNNLHGMFKGGIDLENIMRLKQCDVNTDLKA